MIVPHLRKPNVDVDGTDVGSHIAEGGGGGIALCGIIYLCRGMCIVQEIGDDVHTTLDC